MGELNSPLHYPGVLRVSLYYPMCFKGEITQSQVFEGWVYTDPRCVKGEFTLTQVF